MNYESLKAGDKVLLLNGNTIEIYLIDLDLDLVSDKNGNAYNLFEIREKVI